MKHERTKRTKRTKRIEWNIVSYVVDVAILSVAISRTSFHREYARFPQSSLVCFARSPPTMSRSIPAMQNAMTRLIAG